MASDLGTFESGDTIDVSVGKVHNRGGIGISVCMGV